nr:L,D-transpeptidase family protein [uncultured Schaedlerella sp.]
MNPTDTPTTGNAQNSTQEAQKTDSRNHSADLSQETLQNSPQDKPQKSPQSSSANSSQDPSLKDSGHDPAGSSQDPSLKNSGHDSAGSSQGPSLKNSGHDSAGFSQSPFQEDSLHSAAETPQTSSQKDSVQNPAALDSSRDPSQKVSSNTPAASPQSPSRDSSPEAPAASPEPAKTLPWKKIAAWTAAAVAAVLLLTYLGVSIYFRSHYLFHTAINGQDFSCQTADDARTFFAGEANAYSLTITESGGKTEDITGNDIRMTWNDDQALENILKDQNAFSWPFAYFKETSEEVVFEISYDKSALEKKVDTLNAVTAEPIQPQSAYPEFDGNAYVIKPEVYGTDLDSEKLKKQIHQSVAQLEEGIDLQEEGFYKAPKYTTESKELKDLCQTLNQYCKASITYEMDVPVVVDKALISTWLSYDENFHVTLNEAAIRNWMTEFGKRYDTVGTTRPLTTPAGKATEVSGGTYGWIINEDAEFPALVNSIRSGEVVTKAPACDQTAASHAPQDWGGTFAEVDLTAQHMWYLENGTVVFESDVVTGKGSTPTPPGVYNILEKLSPTVLIGNIDPVTKEPEYRSPVDFWMRVTWSGIGFHDATWQPAFGGDVYLWNGSHGCINMPYYNAQELYSILQIGTPVVVHY